MEMFHDFHTVCIGVSSIAICRNICKKISTSQSTLRIYSHGQELFYKFVSNFTNKLVKQLLSMTVHTILFGPKSFQVEKRLKSSRFLATDFKSVESKNSDWLDTLLISQPKNSVKMIF